VPRWNIRFGPYFARLSSRGSNPACDDAERLQSKWGLNPSGARTFGGVLQPVAKYGTLNPIAHIHRATGIPP